MESRRWEKQELEATIPEEMSIHDHGEAFSARAGVHMTKGELAMVVCGHSKPRYFLPFCSAVYHMVMGYTNHKSKYPPTPHPRLGG
jgi:hypothetical protein